MIGNNSMAMDRFIRLKGYQPPKDAQELFERYKKGERYFVESEMPDSSSFVDMDLSECNFEDSWFFDADFTGANLVGVIFDKCNVKCAIFSNANLSLASFREATVEAAVFDGSVLDNVSFEGARYYGAVLGKGDHP